MIDEPAAVLRLDDTEALLADCTACGLCLPSCPTYELWGVEADSPRGRILQLGAGIDAGALDAATVNHLDRCIGCLACVSACPSGVAYDRILAEARPLVERAAHRPPRERALRLFLLETLPYPDRLRTLLPALRSVRAFGRRARVPERIRRLAEFAPPPPHPDALNEPIPAFTPARGIRRGEVGLLLGCVQRVFFPGLARATIAVLTAEGFDVHAPALPDCCGGLERSAGEREHGQARAQATIAAFARLGRLDAILTDAPFCGTTMREYGSELGTDAAWGFSGQVRDVGEFLAGVEPVAARGPMAVRAAYHAACQLHHGQRAGDATLALLETIPGLELVRPETDACCGAVGLYPMLEPDAAAALGERTAAQLSAGAPELIVSGDPSCLSQLRRHLDRAGGQAELVHPIELLWRSLAAAPAPPSGRGAPARR